SPYAGYTNARYGVCQHVGYSYDTYNLNTISQSPHTPDIPTPRIGSINTPATPTTHATSTQYHISPYAGYTNATYGVCQHAGYSYDTCDLNTISQSPHTPDIPTPRPGDHIRTQSTFSTVPKRCHTRWQRLGIQRDNPSPEKPKITAQDSYPRCNTLFGVTFVLGHTPKTDRKWPESLTQNRLNPNSKIR
ncbi:unnamed protein product, partial [Prunus brigantina]